MWFDTVGVVLTEGVGEGSAEVVAFDSALRSAGIADFNLIRVTSIVPPEVPVFRLDRGANALGGQSINGLGQMLPTVYSIAVAPPASHDVVSSAVGIGLPRERSRPGVIFPNAGAGLERGACVTQLQAMITEGMVHIRGAMEYDILHESASDDGWSAESWRCALAALCFLDSDLFPYFEPFLVEIGS